MYFTWRRPYVLGMNSKSVLFILETKGPHQTPNLQNKWLPGLQIMNIKKNLVVLLHDSIP